MKFRFFMLICLLPVVLSAVDPKDVIDSTLKQMATTYNRYKKGEVNLKDYTFNDEKASLEYLINLLDPSDQQKTHNITQEIKRLLQALDYYDLRWRAYFWQKVAMPILGIMKTKFNRPVFIQSLKKNQNVFNEIYELFIDIYQYAYAAMNLMYYYYFETLFLHKAVDLAVAAGDLESKLLEAGLIQKHAINAKVDVLWGEAQKIFGSDSAAFEKDFGFGKPGIGITFVLEELGKKDLAGEYLSILASVVTDLELTPEVLQRRREILKHIMLRIEALNEKLKDMPEVQGYIKMRTIDGKDVKTIPLYRWALDIFGEERAEKEGEDLNLMLAQLEVELMALGAA